MEQEMKQTRSWWTLQGRNLVMWSWADQTALLVRNCHHCEARTDGWAPLPTMSSHQSWWNFNLATKDWWSCMLIWIGPTFFRGLWISALLGSMVQLEVHLCLWIYYQCSMQDPSLPISPHSQSISQLTTGLPSLHNSSRSSPPHSLIGNSALPYVLFWTGGLWDPMGLGTFTLLILKRLGWCHPDPVWPEPYNTFPGYNGCRE